MKPKHPAAGRGHKALACEQRRIVNCNIQGRHALDSVSRVLLLGAFVPFMIGTLPPAPLSSRQTFTTSKRQMQTQSKPAIAPILPSVTEKKVARGRRDAAPPEDGKEGDTASKNNLEGAASAPGMIMHAVMNGLGRPVDRGSGGDGIIARQEFPPSVK